MARKKKEKTTQPEETIEESKTTPPMVFKEGVCRYCLTENDKEALTCKNCGGKLREEVKVEKWNRLIFVSVLFRILSIVVAIEIAFQIKPHLGTTRGDLIIIGYGLILMNTLLFATVFRLIGEGEDLEELKTPKFQLTGTTKTEMTIILGIFIVVMFMAIHTNTRTFIIRPGNRYIDGKVNRYIKRYDGAIDSKRTGTKRCEGPNGFLKYITNKVPFCYEYIYEIDFNDGEKCFVTYKSRYDIKINTENISYCNKK